MAKKILSYDNALSRAASLCARAEHCSSEIRTKLIRWNAERGDIDRIIETLEDQGFIDEQRFAAAFVNDKAAFDHWGRRKIRFALHRLGISGSVADEAIRDNINEKDYREGLRQLLEAKCRTLPADADPYKRKATLFRYAATRGFETDYISSIVSQLVDGADDFDDGIEDQEYEY